MLGKVVGHDGLDHLEWYVSISGVTIICVGHQVYGSIACLRIAC